MEPGAAASPFHAGERALQERYGLRDRVEAIGRRVIRDYMPDEHREFYAQLPYVFLGSVDAAGRPWASPLVGRPGFLTTPDANRLNIDTRPMFGDPLSENLHAGAHIGLLGIDYATRRRNRMTGIVTEYGEAIKIGIAQTFGNCPRYIQSRDIELLPGIDSVGERRGLQSFDHLPEGARRIIDAADHFFIASHYAPDSGAASSGADVSHRGGKPGFVRIDDQRTLTFPDFAGNNLFNTLGNLQMNPRAGLLFIDFDAGDLLYLTCTAEIIWDDAHLRAFAGAERLVRLTIDEGRLVEKSMPIRWQFREYSPTLKLTGSWPAAR